MVWRERFLLSWAKKRFFTELGEETFQNDPLRRIFFQTVNCLRHFSKWNAGRTWRNFLPS
jgi:hypothetical protein